MTRESTLTGRQCWVSAAAFALVALAVNQVAARLMRFDVLGAPAKPFLLAEALGVVLSTAAFVLILVGRRAGNGSASRIVVTVLAAVLGLYVITFVVVTPSPWPNLRALWVLALVVVDCWLCLLAIAVVEHVMKSTRHVGDA